jgi:hypothetical protein
LRERYGDDLTTHPDFDLDLWMEVGSFGRLDKNQVYGFSNTTIENLRGARSVSTVGSSQSVLSTQSKEFMALQQHTTHLTKKYEWLSANYEHSVKWSWTWDHIWVIHVRPRFGRIVSGTTSLFLFLQLRHYYSLIFFWKYIKFVMNIWMNII